MADPGRLTHGWTRSSLPHVRKEERGDSGVAGSSHLTSAGNSPRPETDEEMGNLRGQGAPPTFTKPVNSRGELQIQIHPPDSKIYVLTTTRPVRRIGLFPLWVLLSDFPRQS